jgi:hypothetical protein
MKRKYLLPILLVVAIVAVALLWLVIQKPGREPSPSTGGNVSVEENLFATYQPVTVDFRHPDDLGPDVLPPTPDNIPIYDIRVKSYDFDENKTGLMYETAANDNAWCRIKPLTSILWVYYFDDYHQELSWDNGQRWNPDFNDVVALVWEIENNVRIKVIGSPSTFRNEMWVGGQRKFENIAAHLNEVFEVPAPSRLR